MQTVVVPQSLDDIVETTLTNRHIELMLWAAKQGSYAWLSPRTIDRLTFLLRQPDYMRLLLRYALPCVRDQLVAMWTFGLAGMMLQPAHISQALGSDPRRRATLREVHGIQHLNRQRLSVVFSMSRDQLEEFRDDCLTDLDLDHETVSLLFEMNIRLISQLTERTPRDLMTQGGFTGYHLAMVRVALQSRSLALRID